MTMTSGQHKTTASTALDQWMRLPEGSSGVPEGSGALLKNIWFAVQRRRAVFDWLLDARAKRIRPRTRRLLMWALAELYELDGLPAPVAVSLAAGWVRENAARQEAAFVNGVLRSLLRDFPDRDSLRLHVDNSAPAAVQCALPEVLYKHWLAIFGEVEVRRLARLLQTPAPVTARRRGCFSGGKMGCPYPAGGVMEISAEEFDPAVYYMQDPSTLMAPFLMQARPGEILADLCAAPGGKSLILAEAVGPAGKVVCRDRSPERLPYLLENLAPCPWAEAAVGDAASPELPREAFDGVLLDVPCSNSGVIRRRPDVRWNFTLAGLRELQQLQRRILEGAAPLVKRGGRLIYSTCSIDPGENGEQVKAFLTRHPEYTLECSHTLMPSQAHDGAFAARLRRK